MPHHQDGDDDNGDLPPETSGPIPCGVLHTVVGRSSDSGREAESLRLLIVASQAPGPVRVTTFVSHTAAGQRRIHTGFPINPTARTGPTDTRYRQSVHASTQYVANISSF